MSDRLDIVMFGAIGALVPMTSVGFPGSSSTTTRRRPGLSMLQGRRSPRVGSPEGKTNAAGLGFVDGVAPGDSKLTLLDFAPADWGAEPKAGASGTEAQAYLLRRCRRSR